MASFAPAAGLSFAAQRIVEADEGAQLASRLHRSRPRLRSLTLAFGRKLNSPSTQQERKTMKTPILAVATVLLSFAAAQAQVSLKGSWKCANDAGNGVLQTMPPEGSRLASKIQSFAPKGSRFAVALAKGGPKGLFVFAHFHGIHNDRTGHTDYAATAIIQDEGGWSYAVIPRLETTVKGKLSKSERHRHCGGQFLFPTAESQAEVESAIAAGTKMRIVIAASRNRGTIFDEAADAIEKKSREMLGEYLKGKINVDKLLEGLNAGKKPKK